jgi:hypothetical protein
METISLRVIALFFLGLLACTSKQDLGSDKTADACSALKTCCLSLAAQAQPVCLSQVDEAIKGGQLGHDACQKLSDQYAASGLCKDMSSAHGGDDAGKHEPHADGGEGDASVPAAEHVPDICKRYVSCATKATPAGAAAVLAAYGEDGSCWKSSAQVANDCVAACSTGIKQLHRTGDGVCQLCLSRDDCIATAPACDTAAGECVACLEDKQCVSGACDTSTHSCVECTRNEHCKHDDYPVCNSNDHTCGPGCVNDEQCKKQNNDYKVCDLSSNYCVECVSDKDCMGNPSGPSCQGSLNSNARCGCSLLGAACPTGAICPAKDLFENSFCCVPECGENSCGAATNNCGTDPDYCGKCEKGGGCDGTQCSSRGKTCTPGADDCYAGEICAFDSTSKQHNCMPTSVIGEECNPSNNPCNFLAGAGNSSHFECFGKCQLICADAGDCPAGSTCTPWWDKTTISIYSPGLCSLP